MAKNWYPVINYEKCIECDACFNKCSHGVYEKTDEGIIVVYPEGCVDQCRGCQNLCPTNAIEYVGDLSIGKGPEVAETQKECMCNCQDECCEMPISKKNIVIDFLYLDLTVCDRCQGTDSTLEEAIEAVKTVLEVTNVGVQINKINVISEALAIEHKFVSSPTIRINGEDIQLEVKEDACSSCGDLCGDDVDCRVWSYQGKDYTVPPKAMVVEAILKAVYGTKEEGLPMETYTMPSNLKQFYLAMKQK